MSKVLAIVQARMGSMRFPGKVMRTVGGVPLIQLLLERLSPSKKIDQIVLATSIAESNASLAEHVESLGYAVFKGSENDVLDRYHEAARLHSADVVVRITGDCPLIDPELVDEVIRRFQDEQVDYASNSYPPTYPNGLDTEVCTFEALHQAWKDATRSYDREHVTPYIRDSKRFRLLSVQYPVDHSIERWTVDEPEDFEVVKRVFEHFSPEIHFSWLDVLALRQSQPSLFQANRFIVRNEGATLSTGQKLWKRAKRVIPGGSMLSKRAEAFLPGSWPTYFSRAKGCRVWDLDGRELVDMCLMGGGTNTLGYGHPEVDGAVSRVLNQSNTTTLNCPEEVYLAERLIDLHPWAESVCYARSGREALIAGVEIGRATSGRNDIAFFRVHAPSEVNASTLADDTGCAASFSFNGSDELQTLVSEKNIGVIVIEINRDVEPQNDVLANVRRLASANGIVLVFDERTSGFRQTFGGLHKQYGIEPDMAVFAGALGNGYAVAAVIGRRAVMEHAQSKSLNNRFESERIGSTAGLKTLEIMDRLRSWEQITATGRQIGERWLALGLKHGLPIHLTGISAMTRFTIDSERMLEYKTLITQEMLKNGFLATDRVFVCTEHTPAVIGTYFEYLEPIFQLIRECEDGRPVADLLDGKVCSNDVEALN